MFRLVPFTVSMMLFLPACQSPPSPKPAVVAPVPQARVDDACSGGLLCEALLPIDGWRVPRSCQPARLGQRVTTCWLPGLDWQRVGEFFQSRYPHAQVSGTQVRIAGLTPPPAHVAPSQPLPTPPLLLAHRRPQGVEMVLLAGDPVDTPRPATETAKANSASPRRRP